MAYIINQSCGDFQQGGCLDKPTSGIQWILEHCHAAVGPPPQLVPHAICGKLCCRRWSTQIKYGYHGWSTLPQVVPHHKPAQGFPRNTFSNQQFGFLAGHCASQQLLLFTNNILEAKINHTDVARCSIFHYSKAFDSVLHNELLYKLWKYGVTGDLWLWLKSYPSS